MLQLTRHNSDYSSQNNTQNFDADIDGHIYFNKIFFNITMIF